MDSKVTSPIKCDTRLRMENSFSPTKVTEISCHKEPMRVVQNRETRISSSSNFGDCISIPLVNPDLHTTQCLRMVSTEINIAIPYSANGYEMHCPNPNVCFTHERSNIVIIQDPQLVLTSNICDTNKTNEKPKQTMKSYVLNPEAKEFIPCNRQPKTDVKTQSVNINGSFTNSKNSMGEYVNERNNMFPCSHVTSEDFKMKISKCSTLSSEEVSGDGQTMADESLDYPHLYSPSTQENFNKINSSECLSCTQCCDNGVEVMSVDSESPTPIHRPSEREDCSIHAGMSDFRDCKSKPFKSLCRVKEKENCIIEESLCSENAGSGICKSEEDTNSIVVKNIKDRNHIGKINKLSIKGQNLECDDDLIVFIGSDEDSEISDDNDSDDESEDEYESSDDEDEEEDGRGEEEENESDNESICFILNNSQECEEEEEGSDDESICFTLNSSKEHDDAEKHEDDVNYACDLFEVEFSDDMISIPIGGLVFDHTFSQNASYEEDDLLDDSFEFDFDDVDGLSPAEREETIRQVNKRWNEAIELNCCSKTTTKVKFCCDVEIYLADDWCRQGEWEMHARDRMRFRAKIDEIEKVLKPILSPDHRLKILSRLETVDKK